MKTHSLIVKLAKTHPSQWKREQLNRLSDKELQALSMLAGIAYSGAKEKLAERLWKAMQVRVALALWGELPAETGLPGKDRPRWQFIEQAAATYKLDQLKQMCRDAGIFVGRSKVQCVIGLVLWRDGCRRKGQRYHEELQAELKAQAKPVSISLFSLNEFTQ